MRKKVFFVIISKWRFCWPRGLNYILQVMEEERVNTGKSTEMELKVIIMTMVMISLSFPIFYPLFVYPSKQCKFPFPPNFQVFLLQVLAHNNLIGRIIGKSGATIKKIMEDTDSKITVSSISDISSFNPERVITIKGAIPDISRAEAEVTRSHLQFLFLSKLFFEFTLTLRFLQNYGPPTKPICRFRNH